MTHPGSKPDTRIGNLAEGPHSQCFMLTFPEADPDRRCMHEHCIVRYFQRNQIHEEVGCGTQTRRKQSRNNFKPKGEDCCLTCKGALATTFCSTLIAEFCGSGMRELQHLYYYTSWVRFCPWQISVPKHSWLLLLQEPDSNLPTVRLAIRSEHAPRKPVCNR
jgi:hypothetical protein